MLGARVQSLVWEDPTRCRADKPMRHDYRACALLRLKPERREPALPNRRCHRDEKPVSRNQEQALFTATRESLRRARRAAKNKTNTKSACFLNYSRDETGHLQRNSINVQHLFRNSSSAQG